MYFVHISKYIHRWKKYKDRPWSYCLLCENIREPNELYRNSKSICTKICLNKQANFIPKQEKMLSVLTFIYPDAVSFLAGCCHTGTS